MTLKTKHLHDYLEVSRFRKFRPGSHDCALFAANWVKVALGVDYAKGWRGQYRGLAAGQALLQSKGFADHIALVASHLKEIPRAFANVGDLAVVGEDRALGIVAGEFVWVLRPKGLGRVDLLAASHVFKLERI